MRTIFRRIASSVNCGLSARTILGPSLLIATLLVGLPQVLLAQTTYTVCKATVGGCDRLSPEAAVNDPTIVAGDIIDITPDTYVLSTTLLVDRSLTILGNGSTFDAAGWRAIKVSGAGTTLNLEDVTIINGLADASGGGAIEVTLGATVIAADITMRDNQADVGGAVHNNASFVEFRRSVFFGNRATAGAGGAILTDGGGWTDLYRTEVNGNVASVAGGGVAVSGVAVVNGNSSQVNFLGTTVSNNVAGSIAQTVSNEVLGTSRVNCGSNGTTGEIIPGPIGQTFTAFANTTMSAFEFEARLSSATLFPFPMDTVIRGQVREGGPGGTIIATAGAFAPGSVWPNFSDQTLTFYLKQPVALTQGATYLIETFFEVGGYSLYISPGDDYAGGSFMGCICLLALGTDLVFRTFEGTPGSGSGIHSSAAAIALLDGSTLSGNYGDGALATADSIVTANFSTITNNAGNGLTALGVSNAGSGIEFQASIVAGNGGNDCEGDNITTKDHNLIGDLSNCNFTLSTNDLVGDPLLGPLQDNGGFTPTHAIIDLLSPAVDTAGTVFDQPTPCIMGSLDQRDVARPVGPACDIGAFEFVPINVLQGLIDAALPNTTVIVPDGNYTESIILGDGKTLSGSGPDNVVIDAGGRGVSAITATGNFTLQGITVTGGDAVENGGGIVSNFAATNINLINVVFDSNNANSDGGAIYLSGGTLNVSNSVFNNNTAGGDGGAIYNAGSTTITDTTVNMNGASVGGGVFSGSAAVLNVAHSTFSNNSANNTGAPAGAAIGGAGTMTILNSTISGNTAIDGHGGGIALTAGTARLNNVTIAYNAAPLGQRGGLYVETAALISLSHTIRWGNSDSGNVVASCDGINSLGYNMTQLGGCLDQSTDITQTDALINALAANGGPTETHALQNLSPARNTGHPVPKFSGFDASNFALLQTQGAATLDAGSLLLASGPGTAGSAFVPNPIDPTTDFSATFEFRIDAGLNGAADGLTFTVSDDPTVLGGSGGFLGIAELYHDQIEGIDIPRGVVNGVSVEFDTWVNGQAEGANDPGAVDHIGIDFNGNLSSEVFTILNPPGSHGILSDGSVWTAWVDYNAADKLLEVRASNNGIRPASPTVSSGVDLVALTGPQAYVGFTGATGSTGIDGKPRILSFSFANSCETTDQRGDPRPKGAVCDIGAFEAPAIPPVLSQVTFQSRTTSDDEDDSISYPGVVDIPIIDIPIEKLTGDTFNSPSSAPLGSFPLGSFPIGSFDLSTSPLGSFPLGSFPIGSFPLGSFPLGSFPLSSIPLLSAGGWTEILNDITELAGAPLQTVTLEQLLRLSSPGDAVSSIELRDLAIDGSPLASLSLPGLSLGNTSVADLNTWASNADQAFDPTTESVCATLEAEDTSFTDCTNEDTLLGLEMEGAPVSALSLASLPLGSFPIGSFPLGSFPIGSFPLGSFPLGSFPLGSFPIGSFPLGSFAISSSPLGSFPLGSFPLGSFPLGSFNLLAAPIGSFPLGSFPLGSFPLGSFEIDGKSFCELYNELALADDSSSCAGLFINPDIHSLADLVSALQTEALANGDTTGGIDSTPLGSFPMGSFDISNVPLGSFGLSVLSVPPMSEVTLSGVSDGTLSGCALIADLSTDTCSTLFISDGVTTTPLNDNSSLEDLAEAYGGSLAVSPLGSFPIGSFGVADLPMGSFPMGSFEINGTPLGSFPLGSFDLINSPLGSFPIGSFSEIIDSTAEPCADCQNLADAVQAGIIIATKTLADLKAAAPSEFGALTLGEVLDAMTLAMLYGPGTLASMENTGNLTLGQLLITMMLKTDFPWETIPLAKLDPQAYSADNFVDYIVRFNLTSSEFQPVFINVTLPNSFLYDKNSATLVSGSRVFVRTNLQDPAITDNGDGTQTLTFSLSLNGFGSNTHSIRFGNVAPLALGEYSASATVQLGTNAPVNPGNVVVSIVPDPRTDVSDPIEIDPLLDVVPVDTLLLGYIDTPNDNDFFLVEPTAKGDRVAVFMANPAGDNDLIMYEPLSTVEAKGQIAQSAALDSVPFEDDGVAYSGNTTEEPNALEDVNLAVSPLASISTNRGDADEAVSAVAGDDSAFTIQVSGYNGAVSDQAYTLRVKVTPQVPNPVCSNRDWVGSGTATLPLTAGAWTEHTNTVFLVNGTRLAASEGTDMVAAEAVEAALTAINTLASSTGIGIIDGVVVDVSTIPGVDYTDWDDNPCDVDAANTIVNSITAYLELQRATSTKLAYVTIVGSDEIIPFARKPDETSISNESTFANEFADNAMFGALITRHFLSDDSYGDIDPIPWLGRYLNVPELGVGRLVESAADIELAADTYLNYLGILDPRTALSAGYDFIADAAEDIDDTFNAYSSVFGYSVVPALIDQPDVQPNRAWTREDFLEDTAVSTINPVELVSFNMHFDFDEALPSSGDAGGDYTSNLINVSDLAGADLTGGIWFTVGCHSGSNLPDISVTDPLTSTDDWAQTFGQTGAVYLAQNAYGLGDTEAIALTERLLALFARNLNGSMTIGQAHAFAKQQYFADLGLYGEYDYKALQAATLFGLPMYQYGHGATAVVPPLPPLPVTEDPISRLASASWSLPDTGIAQTPTDKGALFSAGGEVQFIHYRPLQPIVRRDVTGLNGEIAGGAFLTSLVTEDIPVTDIAFARPVIALGEIEAEIETDELVFPTAFTNIASYKAPSGSGPFEPRQQLNVIVGQFTSPLDGATNGIERLFRSFEAQVFYRSAAVTPAAPMAAPAPEEDFLRPEFDNVQASVVGSGGTKQAAFSVDVFDEGTVLRVAVLYLQSVSGTPARGQWTLVDLVNGAGTNWTGGGPVDLTGITNGQVDYMVQAVDSNGNVANSTFKGLFYVAEEIPIPPNETGPGAPFAVTLSDPGNENNVVKKDDWNMIDPIHVGVDTDGTVTYEYSVDGSRPLVPLTSGGFEVEDDGIHIIKLFGSDGSVETFVLLIDNTPPDIFITTPAEGQYVTQGLAPATDYACRDSGSGTAECSGSVAPPVLIPTGAPVPTDVLGVNTFSVDATDNIGLSAVESRNYTVVPQLVITGPNAPALLGTKTSITATAVGDLSVIQSVIVEWGDGTSSTDAEVVKVGSLFSAEHEYEAPGVYPITVRIDNNGAFIQAGVFEFAVIYDPSDGFVTGGGWINSPAGAYTPDDANDSVRAGKAFFGFISKYKKGQSIPDGSTNFRFAAGGLEFESTAYDWMIISGARVRYKGRGTVAGEAGWFKFMVTALDADASEGGLTQDGFRIKIWREDESGIEIVLYDSGLGVDSDSGDGGTTPLGGGSITVHKAKKK